jgi:outer membrane protein TolC
METNKSLKEHIVSTINHNRTLIIRIISGLIFNSAIFQPVSFSQVNSLDFFINQGLLHSPVLKDIGNQLSVNTVDSLLVKAGQMPKVSFNGLLYYAPVINGIGYSEVITNISNITSVASVSQRIFNQKVIEAQYSKYAIQNQTLRISSKITENDLRKAITLQYLAACSVSNDVTFNRELLASSKDEELILKQLVEKGQYRQVDYYSFMFELKSQELLVNDLQIQYKKEISDLNILCGLSDTIYSELSLPDMKLNPPVNEAASLFFTRFIVDSLRIQNEKLQVDRNYNPSLNWFADGGIVNNLPRDIVKNVGVSAGLSLSVPIYDGKQRKLNYDKLKIAENTRTNYADYFKKQYSRQLQQLYSELKETREIIPQVTQQLDFAEMVIKQDKNLLNTGNISIIEYIAGLRNYISVRRNLNQYQVRILQIIAEINYWNQ